MPRLIITRRARSGLESCRRFLADRNPSAAQKASQSIARTLRLLSTHPDIGSPYPLDPSKRQILIPFGSTGYIALYFHDRERDTVHILAFRHQREAGY